MNNNIWYEQDYDININKTYQSLIEKWLHNYIHNKDGNSGLVISGGIGTGKHTIVKNSIKKLNWKYHMLYLENDKSWDFFSNFITGLNEHMVLIIYDANLIFYISSDDGPTPMDWNKNFLNIKGFPEIDWFSTSYFITLDDWRQKQLDKIV